MNVAKIARADRRAKEDRPSFGDGDRTAYEVDADQMYPAAVAHVRAMLAGTEAIPPKVAIHVAAAGALPPRAWDLALMPRAEVADPDDLAHRAAALEAARLVFTGLLHEHAGGPMSLRILASDRWRF